MLVRIDADELYPFYEAGDWDCGKEVDVPEETLTYWQKVMNDFYEVQRQMRKYSRGES